MTHPPPTAQGVRPSGNSTGRDGNYLGAAATDQPTASGRPTWDEYVAGTTGAFSDGWAMGYQAGLQAAAEERVAEVLRGRAADVIRSVVSTMDVVSSREEADTYPGARGPSQTWVAA